MKEIDTWIESLHAVASDIRFSEDVEFLKQTWLQELEDLMLYYEEGVSLVWEELDSKERGREWAFTREAKAPWLRVHDYLFEINQFWWEDLE